MARSCRILRRHRESKRRRSSDFGVATDKHTRYPPFMERKSGQVAQQRLWDETRQEFESKVPEVKAVYKMLD